MKTLGPDCRMPETKINGFYGFTHKYSLQKCFEEKEEELLRTKIEMSIWFLKVEK